MLRIVGKQNVAKVESELRQLTSGPTRSLQLPVHPTGWEMGGESALTGLVITWARLVRDATLVTHIQPGQDPREQLQALARRLFGFSSLLMAHDVVMLDGETTVREIAYKECLASVEMMARPISDFALGSKVFLVCVDHSSKWKIPRLYMPGEARRVRDRPEFATLAQEMVDRVSLSVHDEPIPEELYTHFGAILHELFKNTEDWATSDEQDRPWRRSVRGLAVERFVFTPEKRSSLFAREPALARFVDAAARHSRDERSRFFEFSVFDSGIGLAKQWLRRRAVEPTLSLEEEFAACTECLKKHATSSSYPGKGLGLAEVMATLGKLGAFLRIRSGRLSLYRDFLTEPHNVGAEDVRLIDFKSRSESLTPFPMIAGTHFQIIVHATAGVG